MPILDSSCFGPVMSVAKPNFPLHELCTIWMPIQDADFAQMVATAKRLGGIFNDPATVWNGHILDGRNRQACCQKVGCKFEYREFRGDYESAREWVLAKNFHRRHMTPSQRAMMVTNLSDVDAKNGYGQGNKKQIIAQIAKVSNDTADKAIKLKKTGDELAIERVLSGETSIAKELKVKREEAKALGVDDKTALGTNIRRRDRIDRSDDMYQDATGKVIPPSLQEVWREEGYFASLKEIFERNRTNLKRLQQTPAGWAISENYLLMLSDLARDLELKKPFYICPHCNGGKKCQCKLCEKKWLARGRDATDVCYCCDGHGFLLKDDPYPSKEWIKETVTKESEDDRQGSSRDKEEVHEGSEPVDSEGQDGSDEGGTGGGILRDEAEVADEELSTLDVQGDSGGSDFVQEGWPGEVDGDRSEPV